MNFTETLLICLLSNALFAVMLKHYYDKKMAAYTAALDQNNQKQSQTFATVEKAITTTFANLETLYKPFNHLYLNVSAKKLGETEQIRIRLEAAKTQFKNDFANYVLYFPQQTRNQIDRIYRDIRYNSDLLFELADKLKANSGEYEDETTEKLHLIENNRAETADNFDKMEAGFRKMLGISSGHEVKN